MRPAWLSDPTKNILSQRSGNPFCGLEDPHHEAIIRKHFRAAVVSFIQASHGNNWAPQRTNPGALGNLMARWWIGRAPVDGRAHKPCGSTISEYPATNPMLLEREGDTMRVFQKYVGRSAIFLRGM